jgi:Patatin-like phospholipase
VTALGPKVVVASGHMVDSPDRAQPRFAPDQVDRVTREVRTVLAQWRVGSETTIVTQGARGADLIVAEEGLVRGAKIVLCLAAPPEEFDQMSVALPASDWSSRFQAILEKAEVRLPDEPAPRAADDIFARANARVIAVARSFSETPHAIVVWNGEGGDGPGGTLDFIERLGHDGPDARLAIIDPTRRAYEAKQVPDNPKRMLALDGGGIRGALSLEVLAALEARLREQLHAPSLVLGDWFDYIGGTSTGAIIATALALGMPVDELRSKYESLGSRVFAKRFLPLRVRSLYRDGPLTGELEEVLGKGRSLGDPELRTLLLLVLHNTVTDSAWPLSNCTKAKYNRADRNLKSPSDRNLDLPLVSLVRGSTAAPFYFAPQEISIGSHEFVFADGGITPFNNPALLMFLMATLPEYGLCWPAGDDKLLIVSIGTGSSPAVHPGLSRRSVNAMFNARNAPRVFMNGASVGQDLLCRALGNCRAGRPLDREIGSRVGTTGVAERSLFTYLRYDADLSDEALQKRGVSAREAARLRKLDAVKSLPELRAIGRDVGAEIDLEAHFAGFIESP